MVDIDVVKSEERLDDDDDDDDNRDTVGPGLERLVEPFHAAAEHCQGRTQSRRLEENIL